MVRPNVLALPSPTAARVLLLVLAFVTAGLFVGNAVHSRYQSASFVRGIAECQAQSAPVPAGAQDVTTALINRNERIADCQRPIEIKRATYSVAGALATVLILVLLHAPIVVRRYRLSRLDAKLPAAAERFAQLARDFGLARVPVPMIGPPTLKDAFSYGFLGGRAVALPPAAAVLWRRDPGVFEPLVRHELAHHARRDVALAWVARVGAYVLAAVLLVPILLLLGSGSPGAYLRDYSWRALLLIAITLVISRELMRSREFEADVRSVRQPEEFAATAALLGRIPARPRTWRQRLLAVHPSAADRASALAHPQQIVGVTFVDAVAAGLLAALSIPILTQIVQAALTGTQNSSDHALVIAIVLAGLPLGLAVGAGLARSAPARSAPARSVVPGQSTGRAGPEFPAAAGVAVGFAAGQLVSLGQTAEGLIGGLNHPVLILLPAWLLGSAVVISAGMADSLAAAAGRIRSRSVFIGTAVSLNALLFSIALWLGLNTQRVIDLAGLSLLRTWLFLLFPARLLAIAVLVLGVTAGVVLVLGRPGAKLPAWSLDWAGSTPSEPASATTPAPATRSARATTPGFAGLAIAVCVVVAILAAVGFRVFDGRPTDEDSAVTRALAMMGVAAATTIAGQLTMQLTARRVRGERPGSSAGAAVAFVVAAGVGVALGLTLTGLSLGGGFQLDSLTTFGRAAVSASGAAALAVSPLVHAIPPVRGHHRARSVVLLSCVLCLLLVGVVVAVAA